jgi:hypothetical protein
MRPIGRVVPLVLALALAACSAPAGNDVTAAAPSTADDAAAPTDVTSEGAETAPLDVCAVLPIARVSEIMGLPMKVTEGTPGTTGCNYMPVDGYAPYAFIEVSRGAGDAAMSGAGAAAELTDGAVNPFAGIGDDARLIGAEVVWIRKGADQVSMTVSRGDHQAAQVRALYEALAPHL